MKKKLLFILMGVLFISSTGFAQDILIDGNGNLTTGTSNSYGNLKIIGASGEHSVVGETSGTGAAGAYGKNTSSNNYGILGSDTFGVYGNSVNGYAGYFEGDTIVTGNLNVIGAISGESDPTVNENLKDGIDWTELTGVPSGFADGVDDTLGNSTWSQSGTTIYYNSGSVGIGTPAPAGKLDVNGDICLGNVCRTTWPSGSGSGAFTDTGTSAYYTGGSVGIGTTSPVSLGSTDTRVLHIVQPVASQDNAAAGIRLEVDGLVEGGITSAYNKISGEGGIFIGALSNHRLGFITNSMEKMSLTSDGNLGIGTVSPIQPLHVQGSAYISGNLGIGVDSPTNKLEVNGTSSLFSSSSGDFRLFISKNLDTDSASLIFQKGSTGNAELGLTGDNDFHIKVSADGTTFSDAVVVNHIDGNVGIGTTAPEGKLVVVSTDFPAFLAENTGTQPSIMALKSGIGDAAYITKKAGEGNGLVIEQRSTTPALLIKNNVSEASTVFVIQSTGAVGIGTKTPQSMLQVNGYTQLALTSGAPPSADCDDISEYGRMKIDNAAGLLYICVNSGWVAK